MANKIIAKVYRMRMMEEVRELIESLPFKIVEKQLDNCIYAGVGEVETGTVKFPTTLKITRSEDGQLAVTMSSPKAGIEEDLPFNTEDQQKMASEKIRNLMPRYLN